MNNELNKECDKKSWKSPELILMSVSMDTENGPNLGADAGHMSTSGAS